MKRPFIRSPARSIHSRARSSFVHSIFRSLNPPQVEMFFFIRSPTQSIHSRARKSFIRSLAKSTGERQVHSFDHSLVKSTSRAGSSCVQSLACSIRSSAGKKQFYYPIALIQPAQGLEEFPRSIVRIQSNSRAREVGSFDRSLNPPQGREVLAFNHSLA